MLLVIYLVLIITYNITFHAAQGKTAIVNFFISKKLSFLSLNTAERLSKNG